MTIEPLGEAALILRELPMPAYRAAERLKRLPGVEDAVPAFDTIGLYFSESMPGLDAINDALQGPWEAEAETEHTIPVCYEVGEDLATSAVQLGVSEAELVAHHSSALYRCLAIGFCPGFPYLGDVPERIQGLARRPTPRVRVEPGSVAIAGRQTGIYPLPRPGGWWIIGRTPLTIVNVDEGYFPLNAGDRVRFQPIGKDELEARQGERL